MSEEKFEASNGKVIVDRDSGLVTIDEVWLGRDDLDAIHEYVQAKQDKELDRDPVIGNELTIEWAQDPEMAGWLCVDDRIYSPEESDHIYAFFQHERDQELGRWRDPENPNMVVYPGVIDARVMNEIEGRSERWARWETALLEDWLEGESPYVATARRYFDAHPEPKPDRPWEDAKEGEVWVLDFKDKIFGAQGTPALATESLDEVTRFDFGGLVIDVDDPAITSAHRIWPEPEEADDA